MRSIRSHNFNLSAQKNGNLAAFSDIVILNAKLLLMLEPENSH